MKCPNSGRISHWLLTLPCLSALCATRGCKCDPVIAGGARVCDLTHYAGTNVLTFQGQEVSYAMCS